MQDDMLSWDGIERMKRGLPARTIDPALEATAQQWAESMARRRALGHENMSGRAAANGWTGTTLAENVAMGSDDAAGTYRQWMGSRGHRANILDASTPLAGFGHAVSDDRTHYWAANYGAKSSGAGGGDNGTSGPRRRWWQWLLTFWGGKK
jgi:uncharacterized protein YkwD